MRSLLQRLKRVCYMKYRDEIQYIEKLVKDKDYLGAIEYIENHVKVESIRVRLLKAEALQGLGRYEELDRYFISSSELSYPTDYDLKRLQIEIDTSQALQYEIRTKHLMHIRDTIEECLSNKETFYLIHRKNELVQLLISNQGLTPQQYRDLAECYLIQCDLVKSLFYYSIYSYFSETTAIESEFLDIYRKHFNFNEVFSVFSRMQFTNPVVFLVSEKESSTDYLAMAEVLKRLEKQVAVYNIDNFESGATSGEKSNLFGSLYSYMCEKERFVYLFAERPILDSLKAPGVKRNFLHYLTNPKEIKNQAVLTAFAFMGDYLKYLSDLYEIDAESEIDQKSKYDFSIVIPVRNNIETLPYTLKTCLDIDYDNFEIVVSDNSDNEDVENYIKSIQSPKINYYKTPIPLQLGRSFEFAYLKSKGDFLIPIGADEGIVRSSLKALKYYLDQYAEDDIFSWGTLSYNWPKCGIPGEEDKIVIGKMFSKHEQHDVHFIDASDKLERVISGEDALLTMPTLYQRSGMRRRFLRQLVEKGNTIVDGLTQDIFVGVLVLAMTRRYIELIQPVVVIGNSNYSAGAESKEAVNSLSRAQRGIKEFGGFSRGNFVKRGLHSDVPQIHYAWWIHFLTCVLNIEDRGLFDQIDIESLDWERIIELTLSEIPVSSVFYEEEINKLLLFAQRNLEPETYLRLASSYESYEDKIDAYFLNAMSEPKGKSYELGFRSNNSLAIDGEKFGIKNIFEATKFIENILNL